MLRSLILLSHHEKQTNLGLLLTRIMTQSNESNIWKYTCQRKNYWIFFACQQFVILHPVMRQHGNSNHREFQSMRLELKIIPKLIERIFGKLKFCPFFSLKVWVLETCPAFLCLLYLFFNTFWTSSYPVQRRCMVYSFPCMGKMGIARPCTVSHGISVRDVFAYKKCTNFLPFFEQILNLRSKS